jgi:hypothetical protein
MSSNNNENEFEHREGDDGEVSDRDNGSRSEDEGDVDRDGDGDGGRDENDEQESQTLSRRIPNIQLNHTYINNIAHGSLSTGGGSFDSYADSESTVSPKFEAGTGTTAATTERRKCEQPSQQTTNKVNYTFIFNINPYMC